MNMPDDQHQPAPECKASCSTASPSTVSTRKSTQVFGLDNRSITHDDGKILGSKLPTCQQVLRCLMFHVEEGRKTKRSKWDASKIVLDQVTPFYERASIPMITERKCLEKMVKLLDENKSLRAIPLKRRQTPTSQKRIKDMDQKLAKTFQLWPANVEELMKNGEDKAFLLSMKTDRMASFGQKDLVLSGKVKRRLIREKNEAERYEQYRREMTMNKNDNSEVTHDSEESDEDVEKSEDDIDVSINECVRSHHRTAKLGTKTFIPHDIIKNPQLVEIATRMKMTPAQQSAYTAAIIRETGGDVTKVATSYATTDKARREVAASISECAKETWKPPPLATLHWDSKLMSDLCNKNISEERLTVVVGNSEELKLLGVPKYKLGTKKSSGDIISNLTTNLLQEWNCADNIVNLTFDTTASNTGHVSAACIKIQQTLNRALLWTGCRHHIGEVILTHVFNDLKIEVSKSPDVSLFTRLRSNFDLLPHQADSDQNLRFFSDSDVEKDAHELIHQCQADVIQVSDTEAGKRDDYKEFIELTILFITSHTRTNDKGYAFNRPGALHKARWMAKLLYMIKICLFEEHITSLPRATITTKQQVKKVRDFVIFCTHVYSSWWMTCPYAVDAPWNDLLFYQLLLKYAAVHPTISTSATKAFKRHFWFLTAEMIPLALFSNKVPAEVKQSIAAALVKCKPDRPCVTPKTRYGTGFGKPLFPEVCSMTNLCELVGPDSWFMFHVLKLDDSFLTEDVINWPDMPSYITSTENVKAINVINDCAERGVKLSSDFLPAAKSEMHYQNVLQVVEKSRNSLPNLRKRKRTN